MARQQRPRWEDRGKELAAQMTDAAITKLQAELQEKQERLRQLEVELREPAIAEKIAERSQLRQEIGDLEQQLAFARDAVKPAMVQAAGRAGRSKDYPQESKGCFS